MLALRSVATRLHPPSHTQPLRGGRRTVKTLPFMGSQVLPWASRGPVVSSLTPEDGAYHGGSHTQQPSTTTVRSWLADRRPGALVEAVPDLQ
jgi:hypothetical protein